MFRTNAIATVSSGIIPTLVSDIMDILIRGILDKGGTFNFSTIIPFSNCDKRCQPQK
jgi:hypothetical protein